MTTIASDNAVFAGSREADSVLILGNGVSVDGRGGDDWLSAALHRAVSEAALLSVGLIGAAGADRLYASMALDGGLGLTDPGTVQASLDGGAGDDLIWIEARTEYASIDLNAVGGDGDDVIRISAEPLGETLFKGTVSVSAGAGDDVINVRMADSGIQGSGGKVATIAGGAGADRIEVEVSSGAGISAPTIEGGDGDDTIAGSSATGPNAGDLARAWLYGGQGDDVIEFSTTASMAENGASAYGGDGNDSITLRAVGAGSSYCEAEGGDGADHISLRVTSGFLDPGSSGDAGNNALGGDGDDRIDARIFVNATNEAMMALAGNDLHGGDGNDRISASIRVEGANISHYFRSAVYGGPGNDRLSVKGGVDNILDGGTGADTLLGGGGADLLDGGGHADYLKGRGGEDVLRFDMGDSTARNRDRIADFTILEDKIDLIDIDANAGRPGNQTFRFDGREGAGYAWIVEDPDSTGSILYADDGRHVLEVLIADGRGVHADDYSASDFLL